MLYSTFRKTGQGVLVIGEVKSLTLEAEGKPIVRSFTRDKVCSPGVNGAIPEAGRSTPEQVEASRRGGGGPNQY